MPRGSERWAGQRVQLKKGRYLASFERVNSEAARNKGCNTMTYDVLFSRQSARSLRGLQGRISVQSLRDGNSVHSTLKMHVDLNGDGKYARNERLIKASKDGFKVKDKITSYQSDHFRAADKLSHLGDKGYLTFEVRPFTWNAPNLRFDDFSDGRMTEFFDVDFSKWSSEYNPVC